MNLVLIGMPGSGKTCLGSRVAPALGREFKDTDDMVEARHGPLSEIFEHAGEEIFRKFEMEAVKAVSEGDGLVIATGGGIVLKAENVALLKSRGMLVYLRAKAETLGERLLTDNTRPLLSGAENKEVLLQKIKELLVLRGKLYEQAADFILDIDGMTMDAAANKLIRLIQEKET